MSFNLQDLVRDNVKRLRPYSSARDEFSGNGSVFLDANENPYENGVNRYPDPLQKQLKKKLSELKGIQPEKMVLGNGSDEVIDLLFRAFCEPNKDNVIICTPTYGMYEVAANVNAIEIREVPLGSNFQPDIVKVNEAIDENSKILILCSPNNPTANLFNEDKIEKLLKIFPGIVMLDEAYIDFAPGSSFAQKLNEFPNLVILQTLSKAWGMAGIRLGIGLASTGIVDVLNRIKPPYNVNVLSQEKALNLLEDTNSFKERVDIIIEEREKLIQFMRGLTCVLDVYSSDANFILMKVEKAKSLYDYLLNEGIVIRDRSKVPSLEGCVRVSVGTKKENLILCDSMLKFDTLNLK